MDVLLELVAICTSAGINFPVTVLSLGVNHHFGATDLPDPLLGFISPFMIGFAVFFYTADWIESFLEELPFVGWIFDIIWEPIKAIITFAFMVYILLEILTLYANPLVQIGFLIVFVYVTMVTVLLMAGIRFLSTSLPVPVVSLFETFAESALAYFLVDVGLDYPFFGFVLSIIILVVAMRYSPRMFRFIRFHYAAFASRSRPQRTDYDGFPDQFTVRDGEKYVGSLKAINRHLKGVAGYSGTLILTTQRLIFVFPRRLRTMGVWEIPLSKIKEISSKSGILQNTLTLDIQDIAKSPQFIMLKERSAMLEQFQDALNRLTDGSVASKTSSLLGDLKATANKSLSSLKSVDLSSQSVMGFATSMPDMTVTASDEKNKLNNDSVKKSDDINVTKIDVLSDDDDD